MQDRIRTGQQESEAQVIYLDTVCAPSDYLCLQTVSQSNGSAHIHLSKDEVHALRLTLAQHERNMVQRVAQFQEEI